MTESELRELDAWIGVNIFGMKPISRDDNPPTKGTEDDYFVVEYIHISNSLPHYSTDPAAAMEVLKKCITEADNEIEIDRKRDKSGPFRIETGVMTDTKLAIHESLEICICLFAKQLFSK